MRLERIPTRQFLFAIFGVSLLLRLIYGHFLGQVPEGSDGDIYRDLALGLLDHGTFGTPGHPSAHRPPLHVFYLAGLFWLFGPTPSIMITVQAVLGSFIPLLAYGIGKNLYAPMVGRLAALGTAAYVPLMEYGVQWWNHTENICVFLLMSSCFALARYIRLSGGAVDEGTRNPEPAQPSAHWGWVGLGGVLLGLTALTRPTAQFSFVVVLFSLLVHLGWRRAAVGGVVFTLCMAAAIAPWTYRNCLAFGKCVPISTATGRAIWEGYNPGPQGFGYPAPPSFFRIVKEQGLKDEVEVDGYFKMRVGRQILSDPAHAVKMMAYHLIWFWYPFEGDVFFGDFSRFNIFLGGLICLCVLTLLGRYGGFRPHILVVGLIGYYTLVHTLVIGHPRYRLPVEPLLILYASWGVGRWIQQPPAWMKYAGAVLLGLILALLFWGNVIQNFLSGAAEHLLRYRNIFETNAY